MRSSAFIRITICAFFTLSFSTFSFAQVPNILNVNKHVGPYDDLVTIAGSGFDETEANNVVYFGSMKGTVTNSTLHTIEVRVPAGATYDNISVTNLSSGLTGYSSGYYNLSFNGDAFDPANFQEQVSITEQIELYDLSTCDFDGDGLNDVVTTNNRDAAAPNSLTVYKNITGAGDSQIKFQTLIIDNLNTGKATRNVTCGDLNGDGKPDLVVGKGGGNADRVYAFRNTSTTSISFALPKVLLINDSVSSSSTRRLKIQDIDKDGKPDIVMTDQGLGKVFIFHNNSTTAALDFPDDDKKLIPTSAGSLVGLDVADLNGDDKPEIVCNSSESNFFILPNNSIPGSIRMGDPIKTTIAGASLTNMAIADLDLDGDNDITITNRVNNVYILNNISSGGSIAFETAKFVETGIAPWGLDIGDINGDGKPDIAVTTTDASTNITVLINLSESNSLSFYPYQVGNLTTVYNVNVADYNGDSKPDLAYTDYYNSNLIFLRNKQCVQAEILPSPPPPICSSKPVSLKASPAPKVQYTWTNVTAGTSSSSSDYQYSASTPGDYRVTITSAADACTSQSATVSIVDAGDNLPPSVGITNPGKVCEGGTIQLTADLVSGATYTWTKPNGETATGRTLSITGASVEDAGSYEVVVQSSGCYTDPTSTFVDVSAIPEVKISTSEGEYFCSGVSNELSVPYLVGATYAWKYNGSTISGATSSTYSTDQSGSYLATITDNNLCTAQSNTLAIQQVQKPEALFADVAGSCLEEEIQFSNTSVYATNSNPTFLWSFGDGTTSDLENPAHTYAEPGTYNVSLTVGYENASCSDTHTATLVVAAFLNLSIRADGKVVSGDQMDLCDGNTVVLSVIADPGTVTWSTGSTNASINVAEAGTYTVISGAGSGCESTDELEITVVPNVDVKVLTDVHRINKGETAQLGASGADFYSWTPAGSLDNANISNPLASPEISTEYTVTGTNSYGCSGTDEVNVYVDAKIVIPVDAPLVFTPNGDGKNDVWIINNLDSFAACPIRIFNRKGMTVYEASEYNDDWDAILNGKPLPEGAYYYILTCGDEVHSGNITVLR